jgi:hypothetical protein
LSWAPRPIPLEKANLKVENRSGIQNQKKKKNEMTYLSEIET